VGGGRSLAIGSVGTRPMVAAVGLERCWAIGRVDTELTEVAKSSPGARVGRGLATGGAGRGPVGGGSSGGRTLWGVRWSDHPVTLIGSDRG
jgi:hypothetical protein